MSEHFIPTSFIDYKEHFGDDAELPDYFCFNLEHWTDAFWNPIIRRAIRENRPWTDFVSIDHKSTFDPNLEY